MSSRSFHAESFARRRAELYRLGHSGPAEEAPFFRHARGFDGEPGEYCAQRIAAFNDAAALDPALTQYRIDLPDADRFPKIFVLIDASNDRLPTGPESYRVLCDHLAAAGIDARCVLVNTREELLDAVRGDPTGSLVISETVDARTYNLEVVEALERLGAVVLPGRVTAPGSVFSDKGATYSMLEQAGHPELVAQYEPIRTEERSTEAVVAAILDRAAALSEPWGTRRFFVKPVTGGSGVGGFRLRLTDSGFYIPDLSKVTGKTSAPHPIPLDIDPTDEARIEELVWIFSMFAADPYYREQYLWIDLEELKRRYGADDDCEALRRHVVETAPLDARRAAERSLELEQARSLLLDAVQRFEAHFGRRYEPVLCEHIDFGAWGLRAHYRLTARGIQLESLYARIFQVALTEEGVGYVGSDNISNKHTGKLEPVRLTPIREIMVRAVGGEARFQELLRCGGLASIALIETQPEALRSAVPVRCQADLATISAKLGEGNADAARGQAIGTRWSAFVRDQREWFDDCVKFFAMARRST